MNSLRPILVVDDDESIRNLVQLTLEDEQYEVITAQDGAEALDLLERIDPGLILLDMRMPRLNGWEFARRYEMSTRQRAPIVVMTAGQDAGERAEQIKANGFLGKPFDLEDLVILVGRFARNGKE